MSSILIAAALTGFLGSLHCTFMCGPLAMAGCSNKRDTLSYIGGRMITYAFMGAVFGALGHAGHDLMSLDVVKNVALGAVAVIAAWHGVGLMVRKPRDDDGDGLVRIGQPRRSVTSWFASLLPKRGLGLGLVTGILPCGMLMAGWMLAASTASALSGALVMLVFCIATSPGLLALTIGRPLAKKLGARLSPRLYGLAWCLLAVWLGVRPLLDQLMHQHHHGGH